MGKHKNKSKWRILFICAALSAVIVAVFGFTACAQKLDGKNENENKNENEEEEDSDVFNIDGISFKMVPIAEVKNAVLGNETQKDNKPHSVTLSPYMMAESEVTQGLYEKIMGNNPSLFQGENHPPEDGEIQENRPVEKVNWFECIAFCNELSVQTRLGMSECVYYSDEAFTRIYTKTDAENKVMPYMNISKKGFRLPTEAEWEWAAMGGKNNKYAGTDNPDEIPDYAWCSLNTDINAPFTHEVKTKLPNGYGLYDMNGSVNEWCWDWYTETTPDGGENPKGPKEHVPGMKAKVTRGGSFAKQASNDPHDPYRYECAFRDFTAPDCWGNRFFDLGFRIARWSENKK